MIRIAALVVVLAGCNAVFGLDEPSGPGDAGADGDDPTATGTIGAFSQDYVSLIGAPVAFTLSAELGPSTSVCVEQDRAGSCLLVRCSTGEVVERPDAGRITFAGSMTVPLDPEADGNYVTIGQVGRLFVPGQPLQITADGAEVASFTTQLITPTSVTINSPMPQPGQPPVIYVRMADLVVTWNGGSGTYVGIAISSDGSAQSILCTYPVENGTGTIPQALIAELPPGPGHLTTGVTTSEQVRAGAYAVTVQASVAGERPDGDWAAGDITFE